MIKNVRTATDKQIIREIRLLTNKVIKLYAELARRNVSVR